MHDPKLHMLRGQLRLNCLTEIRRKQLCITSACSRRNIHIGERRKKKQGSDLVLAYHHWLERDGEKNNNIKEALCQSVHKEVSRVLCTSKQITEKKKRFALRHRCLKAKCTREAFVRDAKFVQNSQFCFFMHDPWHVYQLCWVEKLGINVKKVKKKGKDFGICLQENETRLAARNAVRTTAIEARYRN